MSLFRIDASIRREGSVSREVADTLEAAWDAVHPGGPVTHRDLGTNPLPATVWANAVAAGHIDPADRSPEQRAAVALAAALVDELLDADAYVVAAPLYNYGVPQHLKSWIDLVITDPRMATGGDRPLAGRPLVLIVARGGGYGAGTPREGWDHATPYLERIFGDVFGMDIHLVEAELTLADVVPAMEALRDTAAQVRRDAHAAAGTHGRELAERVLTGAAA